MGDAGNAADPPPGGVFGSVPRIRFKMAKYGVTLGQYCQFLNAVATTATPMALYNRRAVAKDLPNHSASLRTATRENTATRSPATNPGANTPTFAATWVDAARLCNWLKNGQPTRLGGKGHDGRVPTP